MSLFYGKIIQREKAMHLLFLDESGTVVPENKKHSKYFVIGGIIIPEIHWHDLYEKLKDIKKQYKITSEIKWRYFAPNNNDDENGMKHLTYEQKNEVRNKLYNIISSYKSVKVLASITEIEEAYKLPYINSKDDLYWYGYKPILERFQYYLQDTSRESGVEINGLVIIDNRLSCDDDRLRNLHHKVMVADKTNYSNFNNLIEGLFIAPSHLSVGVQFADIVAGALFRKYEKGDNQFYDKIKNSIRQKYGKILGYGLIKIPQGKN